MDIDTNINTFFGMTEYHDSIEDENTYRVGSSNQLPIALALLMHSRHKNIISRYFNLKTHDQHADELADTFLKQTINLTDFINQFNDIKPYDNKIPFSLSELEPWTPPKLNSKTIQDLINIPNYDIIFDFDRYAIQFADFLSMKTYHYHTCSTGTPMVCGFDYINYHNRPEFTAPFKAIDHALNSIMQDVIRIMKIRGIEFNEYNMTINVPEFIPMVFSVYRGF